MSIRVGCRVSSKIGELVDNPDSTLLGNGKKRRRVRLRATGVVVAPDGLRKWKVRLDHNNNVVSMSSTTLKVIEETAGLPLVSTVYFVTLYNCFYTNIVISKIHAVRDNRRH